MIRKEAISYQLELYEKVSKSGIGMVYCHHCSEVLLYLRKTPNEDITCPKCLCDIAPEECCDVLYPEMERMPYYNLTLKEKLALIERQFQKNVDSKFEKPESSQLKKKGYLDDNGNLTPEGVIEAENLIKLLKE